jgi:hypothetical protein
MNRITRPRGLAIESPRPQSLAMTFSAGDFGLTPEIDISRELAY